jgi:hypothetical protein
LSANSASLGATITVPSGVITTGKVDPSMPAAASSRWLSSSSTLNQR